MSHTATRLLRRGGSGLLWYVLPGLALATVVAYILAAIVLHVNPPVVPIEGVSMRPTLQTGELVFLEGVEPSRIHKGEIIAVNVPKEARQKYNLPGRVVHRVIKIEHTAGGLTFQTKGDGNAGPDVFTVSSNEVVGRMTGHVPGLGYPLLFFRSTQGKILAGAIAIIALLYFLMGLFEERQTAARGTALGLQAVLEQTEEIKQVINGAAPPSVPATASPIVAAAPPTVVQHDENTQTLDKLLVAVGEYGEHLRSHTAVMQGLAQATSELRQATEDLRRATAGSSPQELASSPKRSSTSELETSEPFLAGAGGDPFAAPFSPSMVNNPTRTWMREPIEPRTVLLLTATTVTALYLRRRLARRG